MEASSTADSMYLLTRLTTLIATTVSCLVSVAVAVVVVVVVVEEEEVEAVEDGKVDV